MDSSSSSGEASQLSYSIIQELLNPLQFIDQFGLLAQILLFELPATGVGIAIAGLLLLLCMSSLVSGSEVAYFSLSSSDLHHVEQESNASAQRIRHLLDQPRYLLATILIANNLFNVAIVIISYYVVSFFIDFAVHPLLGFSVNVIGVTFILVLFGEVLPKIYATQKNTSLAKLMALPLTFMRKLFKPVSYVLVFSTKFIENRFQKHREDDISLEEINKAIDLTADPETTHQELRILKGIAKFGNITVKQIMKARVDITTINTGSSYSELLQLIKESGYSRIPVYENTLDNVIGVLYVKDLLNFIEEQDHFHWEKLVRPAFFVPDTKKIDDLLEEMQEKHTHMAIVVDEYGGTLGIITLEDILEEVIGEIKDEFDEPQEIIYQKIDRNNYIFDGKTLLNDIAKVLGISSNRFDDVKGDADSLAGLVLELSGKIPNKNDQIRHENFLFTVLSIAKNRITKIKITILENENVKQPDAN